MYPEQPFQYLSVAPPSRSVQGCEGGDGGGNGGGDGGGGGSGGAEGNDTICTHTFADTPGGGEHEPIENSKVLARYPGITRKGLLQSQW